MVSTLIEHALPASCAYGCQFERSGRLASLDRRSLGSPHVHSWQKSPTLSVKPSSPSLRREVRLGWAPSHDDFAAIVFRSAAEVADAG